MRAQLLATSAIGALALSAVAVWYLVPRDTAWHLPGVSQRYIVTAPPTTGQSQLTSVILPRDSLPEASPSTELAATVYSDRGEVAEAIVSPNKEDTPLVVWFPQEQRQPWPQPLEAIRSHFNTQNRYFIYLKQNAEQPADRSAFLLFDDFQDPWLMGWEWDKVPADEAVFPWMADQVGIWRTLPSDNAAGYTIEGVAAEQEDASGGAAVVLAVGEQTYSLRLLDTHTVEITAGEKQQELPVETTVNQPFHFRVDLPREFGQPVRYFIDGQLRAEIPLAGSITKPLKLYLLRSSEDGLTRFYWVGVREYQPQAQAVTVEEREVRDEREQE